MGFKEYIEKPDVLARQIISLQDKLEMLREHAKYARSTPSLTRGGSSDNTSIIEKYAILTESIEKKIPSLMEEKNTVSAELILLFSELENGLQMKIMVMRYVDLMKFDEIAERLKYSKQHVFRLHKEGFEKAEKNFLEKESSMRVS